MTFWIRGPMPGMNEIVAAAKSGRGRASAYSRQKAAWTNLVAVEARSQRVGHFASPVSITCVWREPTSRRDPDNVCAGIKFILDGLVEAGVLEGDGRRHIAQITHRVETMAKPGGHPGVYVSIVGITPMETPVRYPRSRRKDAVLLGPHQADDSSAAENSASL